MSSPFRIVAADALDDRFRDLFTSQLPGPNFSFTCPSSSSRAELAALARDADAIVTRWTDIDAPLLASMAGRVRLIQVLSRHALRVNVEAARAIHVPVATMPSGGAIAVAEQALALMLAVARQILPGHDGTASGAYRDDGLMPVRTTETVIAFNWLKLPVAELRGKTLGLVGFGEIGQEVARRALAFDMRVLYTQRRRLPMTHERLLGAAYLDLEALLAQSDYVSVHVPHTSETEHLIDARRLALMKPGAVLVNTARGGIVDEAALAEALVSRHLRAAALDVFAEEPLPAGHAFTALDNVVMAPHVGGGSGGGNRGHVRDALANIARVARNETPLHVV